MLSRRRVGCYSTAEGEWYRMSSAKQWVVVILGVLLVGSPAWADRETVIAPLDWKRVVTASDMDRIKAWRTAFVKALENARARGNAASIAGEGVLLDPDAAIEGAGIAPGQYRCRLIKLGTKSAALPAYSVYSDFACTVSDEGEVLSFTKTNGSQRPVGLIFPGDDRRQIFLGTMMLGDETRPMDYGRDAMRDMAGAVERVGANRWRLILPYPNFESLMDVIELVPQA